MQIKIEKTLKLWISFFLFLIFGLIPVSVNAQVPSILKSYQYDSFVSTVKINQDTTFDVQESQTFNFKGNFHQAFRNIPINKFDSISDIAVVDSQTNQQLTFSSNKLEKLDPNSWDKFTHYKQNGYQYIEWYYNLTDTTHTWIVKYKVHGGIEFNKTSDRLYWNIFSDFSVPVKNAQAMVILPGNFTTDQIPIYSYRTIKKPIEQKYLAQDHTASFTSSDFTQNEAFTVDISWPKGYINQTAYWLDFAGIYYGYVFSIVIFLGSVIAVLLFWLFREKLPKGKGTIVPEYKPPEDLRPAMAEVIVKEGLTTKGLTATVIDLAVRGYLKIQEQKKSLVPIYILGGVVTIIALVFIVSFYLNSLASVSTAFGFDLKLSQDVIGILLILSAVVFVILVILSPILIKSLFATDYILTSTKPYGDDPKLLGYEKKYLGLLFGSDNKFSTKGLRESSPTTKREFYNRTKKIKDDIYEETETNTKAYDVDLMTEKKKKQIWTVLGVIAFILLYGQLKLRLPFNQIEVLAVSSVVSLLGLWSYIMYEARLNKEGRILKEEWLGFKLYLETAEKYRLQNLTPDTFEKYLPYAMIFGVEKKWAKAFESLNMPAPSWYYGGYYGGHSGIFSSSSSGGATSFSPSSFSASFASSFSSSFGGSGAGGGGGGGGGGAGGGGGGGGGGAS